MSKFELIADLMKDPLWRISNLYKIVDEHGQVVTFKPNDEQQDFLDTCCRRDIILKARQLGFTTLMCIVALDECLFNNNWTAGIIAHSKEDMNRIFDTKVKFAYDNLPDEIREAIPARTDRAGTLIFEHGSSISVALSFRSGTLQRLHISEHGKICATNQKRAKEVKTGALPAAKEGVITIESTAEGQDGDFYRMTQKAMSLKRHGPLDYKFHFYPWFGRDKYSLSDPLMLISETNRIYFEKLKHEDGIDLTHDQQCWYQATEEEQGADMKREYPSTPAEAFEQALEGAYFSRQLVHSAKMNNIGRFPYDPRYEVNTFWDLGRGDINAIWLHQWVNGRNRFIGYYEDSEQFIGHYINWLKEWQRQHSAYFGEHYLPHDGKREDEFLENGRMGVMEGLGFYPQIVPRVGSKMTAIDAARAVFPTCDFDETACELGVKRLRHYRKKWDETRSTWADKPLHDDNSNGADAFMTFATGYDQPDRHEDDDDEYDERRGYSDTTGY